MSPAPPAEDDDAAGTLQVSAYPPPLRAACAGLLAASGASLVVLLIRALLATDPPMTPPVILRAYLGLSALPALVAWLVRRALVGELDVERDALVVRVGGQRHELPLASIADVESWRVPLPQPGLSFRLRTGARFRLGLAADDSARIATRLEASHVDGASAARAHPSLVYGRVKHAAGRLGWRRLLAKYPLFGALVAGVLFQAQQQTAYGDAFGQYRLEGLLPYARGFLVDWLGVVGYLVLYASVLRWVAEVLAWLAAHLGDATATRVRRSVELVCRLAYFAGIPALLALRLGQ